MKLYRFNPNSVSLEIAIAYEEHFNHHGYTINELFTGDDYASEPDSILVSPLKTARGRNCKIHRYNKSHFLEVCVKDQKLEDYL